MTYIYIWLDIYTLVDGGRQGFSLTYCWCCATKLSVYEKEEILTTGQLWAGCSMSVWVKTNRRPSSVLLRYATCKYWITKPLYRTVCNMTVISYVSPATSSSNAAIYLWFTLWIIYYSYFNNDHNNTVQTKHHPLVFSIILVHWKVLLKYLCLFCRWSSWLLWSSIVVI